MVGILIIVSILWGEYRYKDGIKDSKILYQMEGAANAIMNLHKKGLIKFEEDGTFIGIDGKRWHPIEDINKNKG